MLIREPRLESVNHVLGRIKFFDAAKGYGFVVYEEEDHFFHKSWFMEPVLSVKDNHYGINFAPGPEPSTNQGVLFIPEYNTERSTLEAHYVVDAIKWHYIRRDVEREFEIATTLFSTLRTYRVTLIKDIFEYRADNKIKEFVPVKKGEREVVLFEGNDVRVLDRVLNSQTVNGALMQPDTRVRYEVMEDVYTPCSNPLEVRA